MKFKVGDLVRVSFCNAPYNIARIIDIEKGLRVWFKLQNLDDNLKNYASEDEIS